MHKHHPKKAMFRIVKSETNNIGSYWAQAQTNKRPKEAASSSDAR